MQVPLFDHFSEPFDNAGVKMKVKLPKAAVAVPVTAAVAAVMPTEFT